MPQTPILQIYEIEESQENKEGTHNDAILALEQALTSTYTANLAVANHDATADALLRARHIKAINATVARSVTLDAPAIPRMMLFESDLATCTAPVTFVNGAKSIVLMPGESVSVWTGDGVLLPVATNRHVWHTSYAGTPVAGSYIDSWIADRPFATKQAAVASYAAFLTPPSSPISFSIVQNFAPIGSVVFSDVDPTVISYTSDVSIDPGDRIDLVAPGALNGIEDIVFALTFVSNS